jgi:enamine deaminase RidA (YjgF/YER057c/UK114 family)
VNYVALLPLQRIKALLLTDIISVEGFCRAVRVADVIRISGTTASAPPSLSDQISVIGGTCARCQAVAIFDVISRAIKKLDGVLAHTVRTRVMVRSEADVEEVSTVHSEIFWL